MYVASMMAWMNFFRAYLKCWKLRKTLYFSFCLISYNVIWGWVAIGGIFRMGAIGADNGMLDTVAYSAADMRSHIP